MSLSCKDSTRTVVRMLCSLSVPNNLITVEQNLCLRGGEDQEIVRRILHRLLLFWNMQHKLRVQVVATEGIP